ncbi:xanthine dehydrogenase accessory protein XdhC [Celeribacter marinus]|uniref:XdhC protein (Assists in molybdopterin insertion into xanthine dehydrogenase) n=1 Tax=Celeribacter marinus TaxID=1397108 RepID=A0A0N9ZIP6_9RHOB|nr:xanthine dehydrogenase accessory protein XdhC [Celeribacter marinus]ALI56911.1 XdhC protein (assists in molybdopterin insertion into xanthine dehydrogenase) [Celeribacter marinus]SFK67928.1 molybdenum cofactor sulfurylase [Celeribacter marinus]
MSFDRVELTQALMRHGRVARIVVADVKGSTPRNVGASMLVWQDEHGLAQSGTIGGGALEFEAVKTAFTAPRLSRIPLGPAMGQCCGGAVVLLTEVFETVADIPEDIFARGPSPMPFGVTKLLAEARATGALQPHLIGEWMIEPVQPAARPLWVWGAGHVGRAIVATLAPLPTFDITWVDTSADRFPTDISTGVSPLMAANPASLVRHAPATAEHLVLTYSHALDLELCHLILTHGFGALGLIGSATKWARFRARLHDLGHAPAQISRICCPIGQPDLGKHPQAIAIGVAARLMSSTEHKDSIDLNTGEERTG